MRGYWGVDTTPSWGPVFGRRPGPRWSQAHGGSAALAAHGHEPAHAPWGVSASGCLGWPPHTRWETFIVPYGHGERDGFAPETSFGVYICYVICNNLMHVISGTYILGFSGSFAYHHPPWAAAPTAITTPLPTCIPPSWVRSVAESPHDRPGDKQRCCQVYPSQCCIQPTQPVLP